MRLSKGQKGVSDGLNSFKNEMTSDTKRREKKEKSKKNGPPGI
jgi:hypothetical protein